jgi:hypothetical protein
MSTGQSSATPATYYATATVTFPPNTPASAPVVFNMTNADILLVRVDVKVPPGPGGAMGFQMLYAGNVFLPWGPLTQFLVLDNDDIGFDVNTEIGGPMQVRGYNTGFWPHSIYLRFEYIPIGAVSSGIVIPQIVSLD